MKKIFFRGFTLVELMVAVSILTIGITGVSRSFIGIIAALDIIDVEFQAMQFLETKMNKLEGEFIKTQQIKPVTVQEEVVIGVRSGVYKLEVIAVDVPEEKDVYPQEQDLGKIIEPNTDISKEESKTQLYQAKLILTWQQSSRERVAKLETFFLETPKAEEAALE